MATVFADVCYLLMTPNRSFQRMPDGAAEFIQ